MRADVLILRPQPGADASARRAAAMGLRAAVAPLFAIEAVEWDPPDPAGFDGVLLTSANAVRNAGPALRGFGHLPCHAVGDATAAAARVAGFTDVRAGTSDGAALVATIPPPARLLHPCGRDHKRLETPGIHIETRIVYRSDAMTSLPAAARGALAQGAVALLHSPRAGAAFGALADAKEQIAIVAISAAAAGAAGPGWASVAIADRPRDEALLELAAKLCKMRGDGIGRGG